MRLGSGRARLVHVLGVMCGCLAENPAYDGASEPLSETGAASPTTDPATTTSTTTGAGTSTGTSTDATSGMSGLGETTTTGTTLALTTDEPDTTTGSAATNAELRHYDRDNCLEPLWCYGSQDVWNGLPGEVRGAECFDAPLSPPYRVRRIDYVLVAVRDKPMVRFQIRSGDLAQVLYESESLGLPVSSGSLQIPEVKQPVITDGRFCVGFVGGGGDATIGFGADASALPPDQQSYFGSTACKEQGLRDVNQFTPEIDPHGAWCLGAEIAVD